MDLFEYISVLTSIIIGLGMAHLLRGLASLVQHPGRNRVYWVHLVWVGYMFFNMIFFWWWERREPIIVDSFSRFGSAGYEDESQHEKQRRKGKKFDHFLGIGIPIVLRNGH